MKLRTQLLTAPAVACAVLFLALLGFVAVMTSFQQRIHQAHDDSTKEQVAITGAQEKLADVHVMLYRSMTIMSSLGDEQINAFRASIPVRVSQARQVVIQLLSDSDRHSDAAKVFEKQSQDYVKSADMAVDMA
ncbi:MAG: hypothetical protein EPO09_20975, partial [Aquabacterium sp.]|uniref:hypothetical protein n=1 Tax=Aquabacterium sp. TaxID=1872578 RepID=UPI0011FA5BF4